MPISRLFFLTMLLALAKAYASETISFFLNKSSLDGYKCNETQLFSVHTNSPIHCCAMCKNKYSCLSVFYNQEKKLCTGCSVTVSSDLVDLVSDERSRYFYEQDKNTSERMPAPFKSTATQSTTASSPITGTTLKVASKTTTASTSTPSSTTPEQHNEARYRLFYNMSFPDADWRCKEMGGHLAWIESESENRFIATNVLRRQPGTRMAFIGQRIDDGRMVYHPSLSPVTFLRHSADDDGEEGQCFALYMNGDLVMRECRSPTAAVCEADEFL